VAPSGPILAQRTGRVNAVAPPRLRAFLGRVARRHGGRLRPFLRQPAAQLRAELLALPGATERLADAVLLHAAGRPVFPVDPGTRRILARHRLVAPDASLADVQALLMAHLPRDPGLLAEYHALLARVAREYCRARPCCERCPLRFDLGGRPPRLATAPRRVSTPATRARSG
jgi:endonuclease-3 related protein